MASKASAPIVFILSVNILFFAFVTSQTSPSPSPSPPPPPPCTCKLQKLTPCNLAFISPNAATNCCNALTGNSNVSVTAGCLCRFFNTTRLPVFPVIPVFPGYPVYPGIQNITDAVTRVYDTVCNKPLPKGFSCPSN